MSGACGSKRGWPWVPRLRLPSRVVQTDGGRPPLNPCLPMRNNWPRLGMPKRTWWQYRARRAPRGQPWLGTSTTWGTEPGLRSTWAPTARVGARNLDRRRRRTLPGGYLPPSRGSWIPTMRFAWPPPAMGPLRSWRKPGSRFRLRAKVPGALPPRWALPSWVPCWSTRTGKPAAGGVRVAESVPWCGDVANVENCKLTWMRGNHQLLDRGASKSPVTGI